MSETRSVSRRTLSRGVAWSVPAVIVGTSAPAMALSRNTGCGTLVWTSTRLSGTQGTNGVRTGTLTLDTGGTVTVTATQQRVSGFAGYDRGGAATGPTPDFGDFSVAAAGGQKAYGGAVTSSQGNAYTVASGSTTSVLTLNQASSGTTTRPVAGKETITLSFKSSTGTTLAAQSISFNIYDVTSQTVAQGATKARSYTDQLSVSGATLSASGATGSPSTYTTTTTSITGTSPSTNTGNYTRITLSPTSSAVTLTYENANTAGLNGAYSNHQYIGIGDLRVCF